MNKPLFDIIVDLINSIPRISTLSLDVRGVQKISEYRCIDLSLPRGCGKTTALDKLHFYLPEAVMVSMGTQDFRSPKESLAALNNRLNFEWRGTRNALTYLLVDEVELHKVFEVLSRYPMHISPNLVIVRLATNTH